MSRAIQSRRRPSPAALLAKLGVLSLHGRLLACVCAVALVLRVWPLGGGSIEYDEGVYWQSLRAMAAGHPLFSSVFSSQPPGFLLGIYPLYMIFGQTLASARFAVVLYSLVAIVAIYVAGRAIAGRTAGLLAAVMLAADPLYLSMSHTLEAETPALAWEIVCLALAASAMRGTSRRRWILAAASGMALGIGMMTKLLDVVAVVPVGLFLAQPLLGSALQPKREVRWPARSLMIERVRLTWPALALFVAGALGSLVLLLLPFLTHLGAVYDQSVRFHIVAASLSLGIRHNLQLMIQSSAYPVLSGIVVALALALILASRRFSSWIVLPPIVWLAATFVVLVRQQPLFIHHLVSLAPPLALSIAVVIVSMWNALTASAQALGRVATARSVGPVALVALSAGIVLLSLIINIPNDLAAAQPLAPDRLTMVAALRAASLPQDTVVTDDQFLAALADRDVPPQLVDTSSVRITSGYLTASQIETIITSTDTRYVLFASGRFDAIPGFRAWITGHFTRVADFGQGRALYIKTPHETAPAPV